jgi:tRNA pseudouridine38-40 synthase
MKFKLYIEYNGANYAGWQKQKNAKTLQGTLIECIETVFSKTKGMNKLIDFQGAGRTDKGVHALEQIAHLECESMLAPEILKMKLNDLLPSDINILEIEKSDKRFHARHSAVSRQYVYVISKRRNAFEKRYIWWIKDRLDVRKMKEAASLLKGMHDFASFSDNIEEEKSTLVDVEEIKIIETNEKILIRIRASHFLWKMVRRIVGVLVEVGRSEINKETINNMLASYTGNYTRYTAPPSGLFLEKIYYHDN